MRLTYNSHVGNAPPTAQAATPNVRAVPPFAKYGSSYGDLMRAYGDRNAAEYSLAASQADSDYELRHQQATQQLALQGLQQMAQAQQNEQSVANQRLGNSTGLLSSLLSGVFS